MNTLKLLSLISCQHRRLRRVHSFICSPDDKGSNKICFAAIVFHVCLKLKLGFFSEVSESAFTESMAAKLNVPLKDQFPQPE